MKILSLSDLHLDFNNQRLKRNITNEIADFIKEVNPDRIIIAGDMAGGASECIRYIEEIEQKTGKPISYVPGNHSIWTSSKGHDSWREYERLKNHHSSLIDKPVHLNDEWVIVGDMGWYDYSLGERHINREETIIHKKHFWNDHLYARFGISDEEFCEQMIKKFEKMIEENRNKKIILVNHFIPYKMFVTYKPGDDMWNFCNAFMGTEKLGELIDKNPNVKWCIFGHTHRRYGTVEFGELHVVCNPLGYVGEWTGKNVRKEIEKASTIITL